MKLLTRLMYIILLILLLTIMLTMYAWIDNDGNHHMLFNINEHPVESYKCWKSRPAIAEMHVREILNQVNSKFQLSGRQSAGPGGGGVNISMLASKQGQPLTVIIVPHSHNDPNWIKSYHEYYHYQTAKILSNMVHFLSQWKNMTFLWTETVFLSTWWLSASGKDQAALKQLIKEGRLEITSGGWVSPDEAGTHVFALVDQLVEGHLWLRTHLGIVPENVWNIDPFGLSLSASYLAQKAGFKHAVILRVSDHIKEIMRRNASLEFLWCNFWDDPKDAVKKSAHLMTSVLPFMLYNHKYSCGPDPSVCLQFDFRDIAGEQLEGERVTPVTPENVKRMAELLYSEIELKSRLFRHNVILYPLGDDFRWDHDVEWLQQFTNFNQLMRYMNQRTDFNIELRWGTLADYFAEVEAALPTPTALPSLVGDFFVYTDREEEYWSGYFTTRPMLKRWCREVQNVLRMADILFTLAQISGTWSSNVTQSWRLFEDLSNARREHALFQHHDSITGTTPDQVANTEYVRMLSNAFNLVERVLSASTAALSHVHAAIGPPHPLRLTQHRTAEEENRLSRRIAQQLRLGEYMEYVVLNPIAQWREDCTVTVLMRNQFVRVEYVDQLAFVAAGAQDSGHGHEINLARKVKCQVNPWLQEGHISDEVFEVSACLTLPPLGSRVIRVFAENSARLRRFCPLAHVAMNHAHDSEIWQTVTLSDLAKDVDDANLFHLNVTWGSATFNSHNGFMVHYRSTTLGNRRHLPLSMEMGVVRDRGTRGAYIMDPISWKLHREAFAESNHVIVMQGPVLSRVRVVQNAFIHSVTLYQAPLGTHLAGVLHIHNVVSMLDEVRNSNFVLRLRSAVHSGTTFYTDANDMAMVRRERRPHFPVAANYYPISSAVMLEDDQVRLNVLAAQAHGASSCAPGSLDVMLHRVFDDDDHRGMGSGVSSDFAAESDFFVVLERRTQSFSSRASVDGAFLSASAALASRCATYPLLLMSMSWSPSFTAPWPRSHLSPLLGKTNVLDHSPLPCDVEVLSLRWLNSSAGTDAMSALLILHRSGSACELAAPLAVCQQLGRSLRLRHLFRGVEVVAANETTLTGVTMLRQLSRTDEILNLNSLDLRSYLLRLRRSAVVQ